MYRVEHRRGVTHRSRHAQLDVQDIDKIQIDAGVLSIWETGAKKGWFSSSGITSVKYADLGNARFFLIACDKLLGIRF